jgi:hypothetical protein
VIVEVEVSAGLVSTRAGGAFVGQIAPPRSSERRVKGGPVTSVARVQSKSPLAAAYRFYTKTKFFSVQISVGSEPPHLVEGLWFGPVSPRLQRLAEVTTALRALPGKVSFGVCRLGGKEPALLQSLNPELSLALRCLFFKRTFGLLGKGLRDADENVRGAALEALGRLHFNHAFDPLVHIFREIEEPRVKAIALESIGRIPSLEAGDFRARALARPGQAVARRVREPRHRAHPAPALQHGGGAASHRPRGDPAPGRRARRLSDLAGALLFDLACSQHPLYADNDTAYASPTWSGTAR